MKKEISGEYLAPNVEVMEMNSREVLCASTDMGIEGNPFGGNVFEWDW